MNEHEAQRIAASAHELRPDWPASSVLTLIRKNLMDKPRRDVAVALAWIACETNTATPARILEQGPWWKAAAIEGATTGKREWPDDHQRCRTCSLSQTDHDRLWRDNHPFEAAVSVTRGLPGSQIAAVVAELRDHKAADPPPRPEPERTTAGTDRVAPVRAALAAERTDTEEAT